MITHTEPIDWLRTGDVSIQYQTKRDLLEEDDQQLQRRIAIEGWGERFLAARQENGHWGRKYYQPKWTSTHYTLLDLKNLAISPDVPAIRQCVDMVLENEKAPDGGILPIGREQRSDLCIDGMFLNVASYFLADENQLQSIADLLLREHMGDGGFNCECVRRKVVHSSLHTTISCIEGITEYLRNGYGYRAGELAAAADNAREFILMHRLFRSDRTGEIIDRKMLMLSWPGRWRYDILRALEHFREAGCPYDPRMDDAIEVLLKKRRRDGTWPLQAKHPGQVHFDMEQAGQPSRWNTLRALRVLKHFDKL